MKTLISTGYNSITNQLERTFSDGTVEPVSNLYDSDNNEMIRAATVAERVASDLSEERGEHGHILVDGRRCYVAA